MNDFEYLRHLTRSSHLLLQLRIRAGGNGCVAPAALRTIEYAWGLSVARLASTPI